MVADNFEGEAAAAAAAAASNEEKAPALIPVAEPKENWTVSVVKKTATRPTKKKTCLVSRKVRPEEDIARDALEKVSSPEKLRGVRRTQEGLVLERSILGSVEHFERYAAATQDNSNGGSALQSTVRMSDETSCSRQAARCAGSEGHSIQADLFPKQPLPFDPVRDRERYFAALASLRQRMTEESETTRREEEKYVSSLTLSDSLCLNREDRVLQKWIDQQRDWHRLSHGLSKITSKRPEELVMMSSTEDWREQTEVYEVMQSVIPDHVRYAEHYWEMSLRNHGQRIVHVGNIFSGLFCPIQRENKIPPQIRKPRREKHIVETKRKTWRDDPYLRARQKQWTEKLKKTKKIPHEITLEEASDLAVVGRDLFEWAAESSAAYIDRLEAERKKPVGEELREIVVRTEVMVEEEAEQPTLVCLGPRELTFISSIAQPVYASLRLENRGSTVVYYEWRRVTRHAAEYDDCAYNVSKVGALSRDVVFFCLNPRGSLSPRHSEEASFVFQSKVSGQFADEWELVVAPLTKTDVWKIALRGIVTPTEDQAHLRAAVDVEFVTQLSHSGVKQLVVDDVVAMVRTPNETRRQRRRQREEEAFGIASTPRNLYYTLDRYEALATLWLEASQFISELARPASSEVVEVNVANEALSLVQQAWDGDVDTIRRVLDGVEFRASSREEDEPCEATQAKKEPEEQGEDENEYDEDEDEKTEWPELTVEKQDPTLTDPRAVRLRALEARWRCLVCEAATRNEVTISKTPDLTAVALALAAAERTAGLSDTPAPMVNDEAWASLLEGVQLDEGNEPEVVAANNVEANGGSGEAAYRAGAVAAVMHILTTLEVHTPLSRFCQERSVSLSHVAVARATDVEGRVVLFQANLDICFELEERVWSLGDGAEQRIDQTARSLLAFLPILEDNNKRKTEPVVNVGPPRAVVLITEITSDEQRPSSVLLVDALKTSAAGGRYLVEFCGSVTSLEERLATLDNASSLVPLLVLEARNSEHLLCPPRPATEMPPSADDVALPRWAESEAIAAQHAFAAAFEAADAGARLTGLVDVVVHDDLKTLGPTPSGTPQAHDTSARSLARLKNVDRFAGACLKNHLNVAARLLSCDRPLVIVLGDTERHAFGTKKNGLVARAGELDFWIDHADEILLAGRLALECLAALGVQTGKHDIDVAVLPIASKLLAKATRNDVHLQLPTDFATGNLLVDKTGVVGGGGIEIDEDDSADEDGDEVVEAEEEDDDEDPAAGYDYDGDVGDAVVKSGGIPADAYALDLGPVTCDLFKSAVGRARSVYWEGLLGTAECAAFQTGTREITEACVCAHDDRNALVVICGGATVMWVGRFASVDAFGDGDAVTHLADPDGREEPFSFLLAGGTMPGIARIQARDPLPDELMLDAELRARAAEMEDEEDEDEDEEEEEEEEESDD